VEANIQITEPVKKDSKGGYFYINTSERVYTLIAGTDKELQYWYVYILVLVFNYFILIQ
jgi:hypothetical protein